MVWTRMGECGRDDAPDSLTKVYIFSDPRKLGTNFSFATLFYPQKWKKVRPCATPVQRRVCICKLF